MTNSPSMLPCAFATIGNDSPAGAKADRIQSRASRSVEAIDKIDAPHGLSPGKPSLPSTEAGVKPIWLTVGEGMRVSSIRRTRFYELLADGTIKSIKLGRKRLISLSSIESLGTGDKK
jgi:hypothetical protein